MTVYIVFSGRTNIMKRVVIGPLLSIISLWDAKKILAIDFTACGETTTSEDYCGTFERLEKQYKITTGLLRSGVVMKNDNAQV
ncbi:hypothetical protein J6590_031092 [Homalodisca vitripennis]|nr:hypothetical protein J6590_031092 [Homalodisca vitripennis]